MIFKDLFQTKTFYEHMHMHTILFPLQYFVISIYHLTIIFLKLDQNIINFPKHKSGLKKKSQDFISMLPSYILRVFVWRRERILLPSFLFLFGLRIEIIFSLPWLQVPEL